MQAKCIKEYFDKELERYIKVNEEIKVSSERGKRLLDAKVAIELESKDKEAKK